MLVPLGGDGVASERSSVKVLVTSPSTTGKFSLPRSRCLVSMPSGNVFHSFANISVNKMLFTNIKIWFAEASSSKLGQW